MKLMLGERGIPKAPSLAAEGGGAVSSVVFLTSFSSSSFCGFGSGSSSEYSFFFL